MTYIFSRCHALVDKWLSWYGNNIYAGIYESNTVMIINNELKGTILQMRLVIVQTTNNEQMSSVTQTLNLNYPRICYPVISVFMMF